MRHETSCSESHIFVIFHSYFFIFFTVVAAIVWNTPSDSVVEHYVFAGLGASAEGISFQ